MSDETKRYDSEETMRYTAEKTELYGSIKKRMQAFQQEVGEKICGNYRILECLSDRTGEAVVYLCKDTQKNRQVVVKLYRETFRAKDKVLEQLKGIEHPDLITLYEYGEWEGHAYEVMEYAEGKSLEDFMPFSEKELLEVVIPEMVNALEYCHSKGIIHRDLKPSNLFYRKPNKHDIVLGDFGISSVLDASKSVRKTSRFMTPDYAAPETFAEHVAAESDYYSLGITLIHLLTGVSPLAGKTHQQIMYTHLSGQIFLPDNISKKFSQLLKGLLVKERKKRWGVNEVKKWLKGEVIEIFEDILEPINEYSLGSVKAKNPLELSNLVEKYGELGKRHLYKGWIRDWILTSCQMDELASKIEQKAERASDSDLGLFALINLLNPSRPYYFAGENITEISTDLSKVAELMSKNKEAAKKEIFFNKKFEVWLDCFGYENFVRNWIEIKDAYREQQDRGLQVFFEMCGFAPCEINIIPDKIDFGKIGLEQLFQRKIKKKFVIEQTEPGYLIEGNLSLTGMESFEQNNHLIKSDSNRYRTSNSAKVKLSQSIFKKRREEISFVIDLMQFFEGNYKFVIEFKYPHEKTKVLPISFEISSNYIHQKLKNNLNQKIATMDKLNLIHTKREFNDLKKRIENEITFSSSIHTQKLYSEQIQVDSFIAQMDKLINKEEREKNYEKIINIVLPIMLLIFIGVIKSIKMLVVEAGIAASFYIILLSIVGLLLMIGIIFLLKEFSQKIFRRLFK